MERTAKKAVLIITWVLLLAIPVFLIVCALCLPARYEETFLGELREKCRRLEEIEGKRIILAGGSGIAFGYDSSMLEGGIPGVSGCKFRDVCRAWNESDAGFI